MLLIGPLLGLTGISLGVYLRSKTNWQPPLEVQGGVCFLMGATFLGLNVFIFHKLTGIDVAVIILFVISGLGLVLQGRRKK